MPKKTHTLKDLMRETKPRFVAPTKVHKETKRDKVEKAIKRANREERE